MRSHSGTLPALALAALLALTACNTPTTTGTSQDFVIIRYDAALAKREGSIQQMADKECSVYGRKARYVSTQADLPFGVRHDRFACEKPDG